jgi:hypothetical protein
MSNIRSSAEEAQPLSIKNFTRVRFREIKLSPEEARALVRIYQEGVAATKPGEKLGEAASKAAEKLAEAYQPFILKVAKRFSAGASLEDWKDLAYSVALTAFFEGLQPPREERGKRCAGFDLEKQNLTPGVWPYVYWWVLKRCREEFWDRQRFRITARMLPHDAGGAHPTRESDDESEPSFDPESLKKFIRDELWLKPKEMKEMGLEPMSFKRFAREELGLEPKDFKQFIRDHHAELTAQCESTSQVIEMVPPMKFKDAKKLHDVPLGDPGARGASPDVGDDINDEQAALDVEQSASIVSSVRKREKDPETGDIGLTNEHMNEVSDALTPDDRSSRERTDAERRCGNGDVQDAAADDKWRSAGKVTNWRGGRKNEAGKCRRLDPRTTDVSDAVRRLAEKLTGKTPEAVHFNRLADNLASKPSIEEPLKLAA